MEPACLILLASVCLPVATQTIEVNSSPVGAAATVHAPRFTASVVLSTDEVGARATGWKTACRADECVKYVVRRSRENGRRIRLSYVLLEPVGPEEMSFGVVAIAGPDLHDTLQRVRIRTPGGALIPLAELRE